MRRLQWVGYDGELGRSLDVPDAKAERLLGENHAPDATGYWEDAGPVTKSTPPASADRVIALYGIVHELMGLSQEAVDAVCEWQFGVKDAKGLTRTQAEQFITYMEENAHDLAESARRAWGYQRPTESEDRDEGR